MKAAAASIAATIMLTGCGQTTPAVDTGAIEAVVAQVKGYTVQICKFLPTDETVTKIITASLEGGAAYAIAKAICDAVTKPTQAPPGGATALMAPCPMVEGVCIEGQFVPGDTQDGRPDERNPETAP